jgi:hypothetical protein
MAPPAEMTKVEPEDGGGGSGTFSYSGMLDLDNFLFLFSRMDYSIVIILPSLGRISTQIVMVGNQRQMSNHRDYPLGLQPAQGDNPQI